MKDDDVKKAIESMVMDLRRHFEREGGWEEKVVNIEAGVANLKNGIILLNEQGKYVSARFDRHYEDDSKALGSIAGTLVRMDERLDRIDVTTGKQEVSITEHIRRTNILEEKVENTNISALEVEVKNLKSRLSLIVKVGLGLLASGGLGAGVMKILQSLLEGF